MIGRSPGGSGSRASHEAEVFPSSSPEASIPSAWHPWETAPRNGQPFCTASYRRFNPITGQLEALFVGGEEPTWRAIEDLGATLWLETPPTERTATLPRGFTAAYRVEVKRRGWASRLIDRLIGKEVRRFTLSGEIFRQEAAASAMSAFGQDPKGLEAKPASAVPKGDAQ